MSADLEKMMGVEPVGEVDADETDELETEEVDEGALKYEAGKKALRAERKRARDLEVELKALRAGKETEDVRAQVRAEIAKEFGVELAREKAVNLLKESGYRGNPERGAKLLDLDSVLDGNGKVNREALSDLVADWKDEEPLLFKRARKVEEDDDEDETPRRRSSGSADLGKKPTTREDENPLAAALAKMVGNPRLQ